MSMPSANRQRERRHSPSDEIAGLELFIGKANCTQCHNGPLFTNNEFHNTGVPRRAGLPIDEGRLAGADCCAEGRIQLPQPLERCAAVDVRSSITWSPTIMRCERAYKVPSLRNVAERAPYMHAGQFATLSQVLDHYNRAPAARHWPHRAPATALERRAIAAARSISSCTHGADRGEWCGSASRDQMTRTVDVVIVGGGATAVAEAIDAARRGLKVLVVIRSGSGNLARRLRQRFRRVELSQRRIIVLTGAEVACVDGVRSIEAVVVRYIRSRRLVGFNAVRCATETSLQAAALTAAAP